MTRTLVVLLAVVLGCVATAADPTAADLVKPRDVPEKKEFKLQTGKVGLPGHDRAYTVHAGWHLTREVFKATGKNEDKTVYEHNEQRDLATGAGDLQVIALSFGPREKFNETRVVLLDARPADSTTGKLARASLLFFANPGAKIDAKQPGPATWLELASPVVQPAGRYMVPDTDAIEPAGVARKPEYSSLLNVLNFWDRVGKAGRGRVQWLAEPGRSPGEFLFIWWPEDEPWRKPLLVSPASDRVHELEVAEPLADLPGQRNFAALPGGTLEHLQGVFSGRKELVALGRDGMVLRCANPRDGYEVYLMKREPGKTGENAPPQLIRWQGPTLRQTTPGLGPGLETPSWASKLGGLKVSGWSAPEGRHLVALSVCSPAVWKVQRDGAPLDVAGPLFADPELWALP